jgi:hypothetical protein
MHTNISVSIGLIASPIPGHQPHLVIRSQIPALQMLSKPKKTCAIMGASFIGFCQS